MNDEGTIVPENRKADQLWLRRFNVDLENSRESCDDTINKTDTVKQVLCPCESLHSAAAAFDSLRLLRRRFRPSIWTLAVNIQLHIMIIDLYIYISIVFYIYYG